MIHRVWFVFKDPDKGYMNRWWRLDFDDKEGREVWIKEASKHCFLWTWIDAFGLSAEIDEAEPPDCLKCFGSDGKVVGVWGRIKTSHKWKGRIV